MDGYMIDVTFDGATLRVHGKTKVAKMALAGADYAEDVAIPLTSIAGVKFKQANPLINGKIVITTTAHKTYQLHFRRFQRDGFAMLANDLATRIEQPATW